MYGFLLIDKPTAWTSHDVVGYIRKIANKKKVGHAGTLDPFATGLLIVGIGRQATKHLDTFKHMKKTYEAEIVLGAVSDTYDRDGEIQVTNTHLKKISKKEFRDVIQRFVGTQQQLPPMYSAKKVQGKKLYELARKGIKVKRKPHKVEIYSIKQIKTWRSGFHIQVTCSPGTYIRTLVHDIGQELGCGAYCKELKRTKIGHYTVRKAITPKKLRNKTHIQKRLLSI